MNSEEIQRARKIANECEGASARALDGALDEIERLQNLDNPYAVEEAVYEALYHQKETRRLWAENNKLRAVADAAKAMGPSVWDSVLRDALKALDQT